jgi:hypothetical protein
MDHDDDNADNAVLSHNKQLLIFPIVADPRRHLDNAATIPRISSSKFFFGCESMMTVMMTP